MKWLKMNIHYKENKKYDSDFSAHQLVPLMFIIFIIFSMVQSHQPYHLDNLDFPAVSHATSEKGIPIYYRGEANPEHSGLYHPPLYIYLLAGWYKAVGFSPVATRAFGIICVFLQGFLTIRVFRKIFGRLFVKSIEPYFWALFLFSPYTIAISSIADIDSTIYGPLLLLIVDRVLAAVWIDGNLKKEKIGFAAIAGLSFAIALGLWAKLTTILLLFPFVFLIWFKLKEPISSICKSALALVLGILCFYYTYKLFGIILNLNTNYTFEFLVYSIKNRGSSGGAGLISRVFDFWSNSIINVPFTLVWIGMVTVIGVLYSYIVTAKDCFKVDPHKAIHYILIIGLALFVVLYYWGQIQPFGGAPQKYHFVFWGILQIPLVILISSQSPWVSREVSRFEKKIAIFVCGLSVIIGLFFVQDRLIVKQSVVELFLMTGFCILFSCMAALILKYQQQMFGSLLGTISKFTVIINFGIYAGIACSLGTKEYSINYNYGQLGMTEASEYVKSRTTKDDYIISMKDFGFLTQRKYFENYASLYNNEEADKMKVLLDSGRVRYAVFTKKIGEDQLAAYPYLKNNIESAAVLAAEFGHYQIYESKKFLEKKKNE